QGGGGAKACRFGGVLLLTLGAPRLLAAAPRAGRVVLPVAPASNLKPPRPQRGAFIHTTCASPHGVNPNCCGARQWLDLQKQRLKEGHAHRPERVRPCTLETALREASMPKKERKGADYKAPPKARTHSPAAAKTAQSTAH